MLLAVTCAIATTLLAAGDGLTFAQALELADRQSPELVAERLGVKASTAGVYAAAALPNPTASLKTGRGDPQTVAGVELRLPFFGQYQSGIAAARAELGAVEAKVAWTHQKILAQVRRSYFALAEAQAQHALALHLSSLANQLAVASRQQFEVGTASRLDAEQAQLAARRSQQDAEEKAWGVESARAALAVLVGLPGDGALTALDPLEIPIATPSVLAAGADTHPEARFAQRNKEAAEAKAHQERMAVIPVPAAAVEMEGSLSPLTSSALRGGVILDLPLFSWNVGAIRRAELAAEQREAERVAVVQRLTVTLRATQRRFEAASRRAEFFQKTLLPQARKVEELARLAHGLGKTPLVNVLQAQRDLAVDEGDALQSMLQAQAALADLEEAAGVGP